MNFELFLIAYMQFRVEGVGEKLNFIAFLHA